jgi:ribosomal protein S13
MRKRSIHNDFPEITKPCGALNENEIEEIRKAYRDKCKGEILIGLRGEERVITMLLPAHTNKETIEAELKTSIEKLKQMNCDRCIHVANVAFKVITLAS